ncbi:MAG: preprotein translocase subunit SecG [Nevskia sp.]|nr:preprotein translocase subunit SecG [Nevskia sp.]
MYTVLIVVYVLVSVGLVGLVLIQHGKGADAGAAFGSGASGTVFGARGSANFLSRTTAWLAVVFFALSLGLAYLVRGQQSATAHSVVDTAPPAAKVELPEVPAAPAPAAPAPVVPKTDAAAVPAAAAPAEPKTEPKIEPKTEPKTDAAPVAASPAATAPASKPAPAAPPK